MEDAPYTAEDDDDDQSESSTSKRRRAGIVAKVALHREQPKAEIAKPKPEATDAENKSWWPTLEAEAEPVTKEDAPLNNLGNEEKQHIGREWVGQQPTLEVDPNDTTPDAAADLADEIYKDAVDNGATAEEAEATVETILESQEAEAEEEPNADPQEFGEEALELRTPDAADDDEDDPTPAAATVAAGGAAAGASGGATPLPAGPTPPPGGAGGAGGATPPPGGRPGPGFAPGAVPPTPGSTAPSPASSPSTGERYEPDYDESNGAGMFLLGGVLGYLLGRRRGRIKTEKKLMPIQKKLEKQVEDLQWDLLERQQKIRKLAAEKVQQNGAVVVERLREQQPVKTERRAAPEATQLHGARRPERIGKVLINAETPAPQRPETIVNKLSIEHQVETLNRVELLELADKIHIEGTTLRQIYETHLINERGLRHLVAEHLQGRDIKRLLSHELNDRQRDFERDPQLRDKLAPIQASNVGSATLQSLIEKADDLGDGGEQARTALLESQAQLENKQQTRGAQRRRLLDVGMVSIIAVLLALVIVLFVSQQ